jgi:branched-chain amino acid transport system permease protein
MVALMGVAFTLWPEDIGRMLPLFYGPSSSLSVGGELITYQELISIGLAAATALGLRAFLYNTTLGISMRGVVDDRSLVAMNGRNPAFLNALSWMIGASLGGLAGILTASTYSLDVLTLTLLILNSFAAAMLGRLRNLILTFVGAIILGLADAYVTGYVQLTGWLAGLRPVLPTLFLFIVLIAVPAARLRAGTAPIAKAIRVPGAVGSVRNGVVLVIAAIVVGQLTAGTVLGNVNEGVALGIGALSIVLLSGYGGQISLAQYAFFGFGAWLFAEVAPGGSFLGLFVVAGAGLVLGALVALPALRLRGLELALSTLAFGELAYFMFFQEPQIFGNNDFSIARLKIPGVSLAGDRANLVFLTIVFAVLSGLILGIRRSRFGRILVATKDSQAACATLGLNLRLSKILLFALSTAIATFGGALYGSTQQIVTSNDFQYVASLFIVLIVYIFGVSTPGGALAGGVALAVSPLLATHLSPRFQALTYFMTGFGALLIIVKPEGVIPMVSEGLHKVFGRFGDLGGRRTPALRNSLKPRLPGMEVTSAASADA